MRRLLIKINSIRRGSASIASRNERVSGLGDGWRERVGIKAGVGAGGRGGVRLGLDLLLYAAA